MIKMKCQWFQLTAGNHREDPHQTGRLPAAGFRHSKCAAAAILCKSFMNTILDATNWLFWQFPQRSDEDVIVLQRQHDPLIASLAFGPSLWCGESTRGISAKKSSKSILSILSLWNMASSLQENWTTDRRCSLCPTTGWFIPIASLIASGARLEQLEATLGVLHPIGHGHKLRNGVLLPADRS